MNKGLVTRLGEWLDARRASRKVNSTAHSLIGRWLPTPGNVVFTLVAIVTLLAANRAGAINLGTSAASSTMTIPYQGRLATAAGAPFTGLQSMEFRLYAAPNGATPLWTEYWTGGNAVNVSDGLFSVLLGSLTVNPSLASVVQSNTQLWLGITIGTDTEMTPRVQLGSAAYSMQALSVPDASISAVKLAGSSVTNAALADLSVSSAKLIDGSVSSSKLVTSSVLTDKLADGAVSSNKLKPTSGFVGLTSDQVINIPSVYGNAPIPQTQFGFTLDKPSRVLIWYSAVAWATSFGEYGTFIKLTWPSGSTNHATSTFSGDQFKTYSSIALVDLPAGSYSGELRAYGSNAGATITFAGNRVYLNYLIMAQ